MSGSWRVAGLTYRAQRGQWNQTYDLEPLGYPEGDIWIGWPDPEPHAAQWSGDRVEDRTYTGMRAGTGFLYGDATTPYIWHIANPDIQDDYEQWRFDRLPIGSTGPWEPYDPPTIPRGLSWDSRGPWIINGYIYTGQIQLNQDWMPFHAGRGKAVWRRAVTALVGEPWEQVMLNYHGFFYSNNIISLGATEAGMLIGVGGREQGPADTIAWSPDGAAWNDDDPITGFVSPINSYILPVVGPGGALYYVHWDDGHGPGINYSGDARNWSNFKPSVFTDPSPKGIQTLASNKTTLAYGSSDEAPMFVFGTLDDPDWTLPPAWTGDKVGALYHDLIMNQYLAVHPGILALYPNDFTLRTNVSLATISPDHLASYITRIKGTEGWGAPAPIPPPTP